MERLRRKLADEEQRRNATEARLSTIEPLEELEEQKATQRLKTLGCLYLLWWPS